MLRKKGWRKRGRNNKSEKKEGEGRGRKRETEASKRGGKVRGPERNPYYRESWRRKPKDARGSTEQRQDQASAQWKEECQPYNTLGGGGESDLRLPGKRGG